MSKVPIGCSVIIYDSKSRILVQLRDREAKLNPLVHGLFGGGIKPSEAPYQAAERELAEELNLNEFNIAYFGLNEGGHYVYSQKVSSTELEKLAREKPKEGIEAVIITKETLDDFKYAPTHKTVIEAFWKQNL